MRYVKAQDILPKELVEQLQQYTEGVYLYIPKQENHKKSWGNNTKTKAHLEKRNFAIYVDFKNGMSVSELASKYFLVETSIRRILREYKSIN